MDTRINAHIHIRVYLASFDGLLNASTAPLLFFVACASLHDKHNITNNK